MSRHKKTRQQKIIAELRRKLSVKNPMEVSPQLVLKEPSLPKLTQINQPLKTTPSLTYSYLLPDLLKTTVLTMSVIALQLILFFLLKAHIVVLPIFQW